MSTKELKHFIEAAQVIGSYLIQVDNARKFRNLLGGPEVGESIDIDMATTRLQSKDAEASRK